MGRVNLFDLSFLANIDESVIKNTFDTVPMGIMEVSSDRGTVKYVRSNQSYRDYMKRAFKMDLLESDREYPAPKEGPGSCFMQGLEQCRDNGNRAFVDDILEDGSVAHCFIRIIGENPLNAKQSVAVAVLSVTKTDETEELRQENAMLKQEAAMNRRIAELKDSVSSLLTNMPGLTFSKDVATGKYLACNQAFAVYANKETPEGVVGLTDHEIFDPETADHFVEDDKKAAAMDEPYVFFEDILDAAGNRKQFQTTKLKFIDNTGTERCPCILRTRKDGTPCSAGRIS